jgi:hypothetical protein
LPINVTCIRTLTWRNKKKVQGPNLARSHRRKVGSSHLIWGVMQWKLRWCQRMWVWEKMVPKCELPKSIPLDVQGLNYRTSVCELKDHVGEKGLSSN